jgi:hypothetical protein
MDAIGDLLPEHMGQKPDEFAKIKEFIRSRYSVNSAVSLSHKSIVITVPDSAVAMELRMKHLELQSTCGIDPDLKIVIRINPSV